MAKYAHPEVLVSTDWVKENLGKPGIKLVEIAVRINKSFCPRQAAAVDDAGVIERIAENRIALAGQRRENSRVRLKTGIEHQGRFGALEFSEVIFQLFM